MAFNKAEYDKKLHKEIYWRFNIALPKDMRPLVKQAAKDAGMSMNAFCKMALEEKMMKWNRRKSQDGQYPSE